MLRYSSVRGTVLILLSHERGNAYGDASPDGGAVLASLAWRGRNSRSLGDFCTCPGPTTRWFSTLLSPSGCRLVDRAPEHPRLPWTKTQELFAPRLRVVRQELLRGCPVVRVEQISLDDLVREVRQHQEFDILQATSERVDLRVLRQQHREVTVCDDWEVVAKRDEFAVVLQDGVRIGTHGLCVDDAIIRVDRHPGLADREARMRGIIPVHGCAPVVSTAQAQGRQHIRGVLAGSKGLAVVVERLDVPEILDGGERD